MWPRGSRNRAVALLRGGGWSPKERVFFNYTCAGRLSSAFDGVFSLRPSPWLISCLSEKRSCSCMGRSKVGNGTGVDGTKETSPLLEQKALARAPGVLSASSLICSPSSCSFHACYGQTAFSAVPELCQFAQCCADPRGCWW